MEKLIYLVYGAFLAGIAIVFGVLWFLFHYAYDRGVADTRKEIAEAARLCEHTVELGFRDLQETTLLPVSQQINCRPLRNVAEGREWGARYGE